MKLSEQFASQVEHDNQNSDASQITQDTQGTDASHLVDAIRNHNAPKKTGKLSAQLVAEFGIPEGKGSRLFSDALSRAGVPQTSESDRIFALPRRTWSEQGGRDLAKIMTARFRREGGTMELRPEQAIALHEAEQQGGLLAPLSVGSGKTLCTLLLPLVMGSKKAVLLVPPRLRNQLQQHDLKFYDKHFKLDYLTFLDLKGIKDSRWRHIAKEVNKPQLHIVAYSTLSIEKGANQLERIEPDLIIADECHNLRSPSAARTKRFLRFFKHHESTRFCGLSGTITSRSIIDYGHLSELALRKNSPLPGNYKTLIEWSDALDAGKQGFNTMAPGVLLQLATEDERNSYDPREAARAGFRRRLTETAGVVASTEGSIGTALYIYERDLKLGVEACDAIGYVDKTWCRPDGEELSEALEVARVLRQLACGFYYRWVWPDGVVDYDWLMARSAWHKEVRDKLKRARPGLDSPLLLAKAAIHLLECKSIKTCTREHWDSQTWPAWSAVKDRPIPPTEAVWLDESLAKDVGDLANEDGPAIVWYEWAALGEKIAEINNWPLLEGGDSADLKFIKLAESPCNLVASLNAHKTGKNLQAWSRMIYAGCPANGGTFEQSLGRCHRQGQTADDVNAYVYLHTEAMKGAFEQALRDARYQEATLGAKQKLLQATKVLSQE